MKKTLCLLLAVAVMVCFVPSMAFASDSTNGPTTVTGTTPSTGENPGGGSTTTPGGDTATTPGGGSTTTPGSGSTTTPGSGGTATPPEVVKNTEGTTTADVTTTVKDDKVVIVIDEKTADKIVEKAIENKSKNIVINAVTNKENINAVEVSVPANAVKNIAKKTGATVIIKTDVGEVELDKATVDAVAQNAESGEVKFIINITKKDENQLVLELSIITSSGAVKDFKGGNVKVTVKLNNELKTKNPVCVYIDDNGIYTKVDGVLNADGTYTFTTGHFSTYAIMAKEEADKTIDDQLKTMITDVKLKVRTSKTSKKNIKAVVSGDVKAITDAGYTVKYKFYRSEKKASKYVGKVTKTSKTYVNTAGKKGIKYYYKAKALVYDGDKLVGQTVLKQCKYGARTWSK